MRRKQIDKMPSFRHKASANDSLLHEDSFKDE